MKDETKEQRKQEALQECIKKINPAWEEYRKKIREIEEEK